MVLKKMKTELKCKYLNKTGTCKKIFSGCLVVYFGVLWGIDCLCPDKHSSAPILHGLGRLLPFYLNGVVLEIGENKVGWPHIQSHYTMKRILVPALALVASFCFGFGFKSIISPDTNHPSTLKRVTGLGGIFFKCKDPKKVREWYQTHLGLSTNQYGSVFEWHQGADPTKKGFSQWSPFAEKTKYFEPSTKEFMINYRVADLKALVTELKKEGVTLTDTMETYSYGKFVHIMDLEGNKIELWEPNDVEYEKMGIQAGYPTTK